MRYLGEKGKVIHQLHCSRLPSSTVSRFCKHMNYGFHSGFWVFWKKMMTLVILKIVNKILYFPFEWSQMEGGRLWQPNCLYPFLSTAIWSLSFPLVEKDTRTWRKISELRRTHRFEQVRLQIHWTWFWNRIMILLRIQIIFIHPRCSISYNLSVSNEYNW